MSEFLWRFTYYFTYAAVHVLLRLRREGPRLPKGPILLAPNHCSFMDPVVIQMSSWRHLSFLMTELYYRPVAVRWFFDWTRSIPVKEGRGNREALASTAEKLRAGWDVCIFPEGQIATDGVLQRFHPGIAALADEARVPVVPVAVVGSFEAFPRHAKFPRLFRRVTVRFGTPIPPPEVRADEGSRKEMLRAYTERVRDAVAALLDPRQLPPAAAPASAAMQGARENA